MTTISLNEVRRDSQGFPCFPVFRRISDVVRDPPEAFKAVKRLSRHCFILESLEEAGERGRYTFIGYDPKLEIGCSNGVLSIRNGTDIEIAVDDPAPYINKVIDDNRSPRVAGLPPFAGGLVGYFSYDYAKYSEKKLKLGSEDRENFKDVDLMLFDKVVAYDHAEGSIILMVNIRTDALEENYHRALTELDNMERIICTGPATEPDRLRLTSDFRAFLDEESYCNIVERAKEHIREGDVFQAVLSNVFEADAEGSLLETYNVMRRINPSPYMFYFGSDKVEIAGASPETLVRVNGRKVSTFPLAGTRRRGSTPEEDAALEEELLSDPKELAEHNMLVDLGRNDIGKISKFGSVKVERYLSIERFSHVMHIGSEVTGTLRDGLTALDAITSVLPAGTLSGAPKLRAMEIIDELEDNRRGIYGGAIGYLSLTGDMDTCIAIRIAYKKNGRVFVRSGAGIVADSVPKNEYEECGNKAKAVIAALSEASGGR